MDKTEINGLLIHYLEIASQCKMDSAGYDNAAEIGLIIDGIVDVAVETALARIPQPKPLQVAPEAKIRQLAIDSLNAIAISVHAICDEHLTHHQKNERLHHIEQVARQQIKALSAVTSYDDDF